MKQHNTYYAMSKHGTKTVKKWCDARTTLRLLSLLRKNIIYSYNFNCRPIGLVLQVNITSHKKPLILKKLICTKKQ